MSIAICSSSSVKSNIVFEQLNHPNQNSDVENKNLQQSIVILLVTTFSNEIIRQKLISHCTKHPVVGSTATVEEVVLYW